MGCRLMWKTTWTKPLLYFVLFDMENYSVLWKCFDRIFLISTCQKFRLFEISDSSLFWKQHMQSTFNSDVLQQFAAWSVSWAMRIKLQ